MFQTVVAVKFKNMCFMFSNFFPENRSVHEKMWKNVLQ